MVSVLVASVVIFINVLFLPQPDPVKLPEEEERKDGQVGLWVYFKYFQAGSGPIKFPVLFLLNVIAQAAYIISDWWLARW